MHAVGRVDVDHLHLPAQTFLFQQRVHDQQRIAGDEAVFPAEGFLVVVEGELLAQRAVLLRAAE
jgi:hypothetical protein